MAAEEEAASGPSKLSLRPPKELCLDTSRLRAVFVEEAGLPLMWHSRWEMGRWALLLPLTRKTQMIQ